MPTPNIVLFGESGVGKSSIVNMLSNDASAARVSNYGSVCTFESKNYAIDIQGHSYNLWDTAGIDEGVDMTVPHNQAIAQLYRLLLGLVDGVNLLVFVMRAPRVKEASKTNWRLFKDVICQNRVPAVIVITGLETEDVMDDWWFASRAEFDKREMCPAGHACITASRGAFRRGRYQFQEEYDESKGKVEMLIRNASLAVAWKVEKAEWFRTIITHTHSTRWPWFWRKDRQQQVHDEYGKALEQLMARCEMPEKEAKELAEVLRDIVG